MFIGQDEILKEEKDFEGYTKVSFKPVQSGEKEIEIPAQIFSNLILEELKTTEPTDHNFIRKVRCTPVVKAMLETLLQYGVQLEDEVSYVLQILQRSLEENYKKADDEKWGVSAYQRTTLDVHKTLIGK